MICR